jgi:hypothetical protein
MSTVFARNVEFSQAITDYQQKLQESSQKLQASEELVHQQNIEVEFFLFLSNNSRLFVKLSLMGTHKQHSQVYRSEIIENLAMLGCHI